MLFNLSTSNVIHTSRSLQTFLQASFSVLSLTFHLFPQNPRADQRGLHQLWHNLRWRREPQGQSEVLQSLDNFHHLRMPYLQQNISYLTVACLTDGMFQPCSLPSANSQIATTIGYLSPALGLTIWETIARLHGSRFYRSLQPWRRLCFAKPSEKVLEHQQPPFHRGRAAARLTDSMYTPPIGSLLIIANRKSEERVPSTPSSWGPRPRTNQVLWFPCSGLASHRTSSQRS